jgi:hypothetical protein
LGTLGGPKIANLGASHQGNFHLSEVTQRITSDWWKLPASLFIFKKLFFMLNKPQDDTSDPEGTIFSTRVFFGEDFCDVAKVATIQKLI